MREGDTFRALVCISHRFSPLGLNLDYEGLLLGMRSKARSSNSPTGLYLTH
jgi:hypothetical protein